MPFWQSSTGELRVGHQHRTKAIKNIPHSTSTETNQGREIQL